MLRFVTFICNYPEEPHIAAATLPCKHACLSITAHGFPSNSARSFSAVKNADVNQRMHDRWMLERHNCDKIVVFANRKEVQK